MTSEKQQKEQLRIPTNLCLKFQAKTPNDYGETALTRFSHNLCKKNKVFLPKLCENLVNDVSPKLLGVFA